VVNAGGRGGVPPANARMAGVPAQNAVANAGMRTAAPARPANQAPAKPAPGAKPNAKTQQQQNQQGQPATK
jgi:hypothetical protein